MSFRGKNMADLDLPKFIEVSSLRRGQLRLGIAELVYEHTSPFIFISNCRFNIGLSRFFAKIIIHKSDKPSNTLIMFLNQISEPLAC